MGQLIVLMGATGAGKSVQGDILAKSLGGVHLSSGELLRRDPEAVARMSDGKLLPAEEVERVVGEAIREVPQDQPIVLDGLPRTMSNVHWLDRELPGLGRELTHVVLVDIDLETVMKRLMLRGRIDDSSKAVEEKWKAYETSTKEVLDHYRNTGKLETIDGRGTVEEVSGLVADVVA